MSTVKHKTRSNDTTQVTVVSYEDSSNCVERTFDGFIIDTSANRLSVIGISKAEHNVTCLLYYTPLGRLVLSSHSALKGKRNRLSRSLSRYLDAVLEVFSFLSKWDIRTLLTTRDVL